MANVIDELVITLGLDSKDFSAGEQAVTAAMDKLTQVMEKVVAAYEDGEKKTGESLEETGKNADKTAKGMEAAGKKAASFFSSIRGQILALAGVTLSLSSLKNMLTSLTGKLTGLATASKAFGMSAKSLDGWMRAGEGAGVQGEEIVGMFARINDAQRRLREGYGLDPALQSLIQVAGRTGIELDFKSDTPESIARKLADVFPKLSEDQKQAFGGSLDMGYAMQQWFGSGKALKDVDEFTVNSGVNDNAIAIAQRWQKQWAKTNQSFEKIQIQLMEALAPHIDKFNQWLEDLAAWMASNPDAIEKAVNGFLSTIQEIITVANEAAGAVGGWKTVILALIGLKFAGWLMGIYKAAAGMLGAGGLGGGAGKGKLGGLIGKAGIYGAIGYAMYDPVESVATSIVGEETKNTLDSYGLYLASDWTSFFSKKEYEAYQAKLDGKSAPTENGTNKSIDEAQLREEEKRENDRVLRAEAELQQKMEYSNNWLKTTLDKLTDSIEKLIKALPRELLPQQSFAPAISLPADGKIPRGIRNNNPGNLNFAKQRGAVKEGGENGRFAVFSTMQEGIAALYRQLQLYFGRGINTISSIVKKYAPAADGNKVDAYITALSRKLGIDANQKIDTANVQQIIDLMEGIIRHENGASYINRNDIIQSLPQPSALMAAQSRKSVTTSHSTVTDSIHIGTLQVNSDANTVKEISNDARQQIGRSALSADYSTGVTA
ncbi:lytic transglycosylase domain-containing protein [Xenorhabdus sp. XENO-10]|uniref:Lytic transglycosylase domain-containing protein n=1 Tax=Xenorhabdus yunnanensis TaxID=3025878 RepID=A0ABT5LKN1_9GAMM|nr:lytic transglycosylase domain-containing protein [Xenorhabdus yunnanensis]MDC9591043.1 lytic transglycosylase domain-containing protein [Xenorhabdus yunnanensis]